MITKFTKGDEVVQILPAPITGTVAGFDVDQETGARLVRVEWADADGHAHAKYFREDEIGKSEAVAAA